MRRLWGYTQPRHRMSSAWKNMMLITRSWIPAHLIESLIQGFAWSWSVVTSKQLARTTYYDIKQAEVLIKVLQYFTFTTKKK